MVIAQVLLSEIIREHIPNEPSGFAKDVFDRLGDDPVDVTDFHLDIRNYLDLFTTSHKAKGLGSGSPHYRFEHLQSVMVLTSFILIKGKKHTTGAR